MDLTVREWIEAYKKGKFDSNDIDTQCDAGWYDWFCMDSSLRNRLKKLAPKVIKIANSSKINQDTMYVWFKNNCPLNGKLYDDFRFSDLITGKVIYTITPASGHKVDFGTASVWGVENGFKKSLAEGTWKDVLEFFFPKNK